MPCSKYPLGHLHWYCTEQLYLPFLGIVWGSVSLIWLIICIAIAVVFRYTWITEKGVILTEDCDAVMYPPECWTWDVRKNTLKLRNKFNGKKKSCRIPGDVNEAVCLLSKYYAEYKK